MDIMQTSPEFPGISDDDSSDLTLALQTANALWKQGDSAEALRWLRRAAETAEGEGNDDRALALARIAAELRERTSSPAESSRTRRPPSLPAPPPRVVLPQTPNLEATRDLSDMPTPRPSTLPPSVTPPPVSARQRSEPPASVGPRQPPPRSSKPPSRSAPSVPPLRPAEGRAPATDIDSSGGARTALRVSVEVLSAQSRTLLVRVLDEGESAPPGSQEALIVPLAAGVDLRRLPNRRAPTAES